LHTQQAPFNSPEQVYGYFSPRLRDLKHEVFIVLILSSANKLIRWLTITEGTLNSSLVHPREVFKHAINELAASIILIHNHPSGIATPSDEDRMVTKQLVEAGKIIGIPVQDHVIIGSGQYYSFAESGIL
jgi:DNA repair protein RadC